MVSLRKGQEYFDLQKFEPFLSLGANDLGELPKRSASYTVNFKLPWTTKNKILLDNIGEPDLNGSGNPQKKVREIYLEVEGISYFGFLRVEKTVPNRYFDCYFATDVSDWSDLIKGRELTSINLERLRHNYNQADIVNSFGNTEGYIYPFINYGWWNDTFQSYIGGDIDDLDTKYNEWYPAIYSKTALEQVFIDIGYSVDTNSDLLKEPRFRNEILPFSNGKFEYKNQDTEKSTSYVKDDDFFIDITTGLYKIDFVNDFSRLVGVYNGNESLFEDSSSKYIAPFDGNYIFRIDQTVWGGGFGNSPFYEIQIFKNGIYETNQTGMKYIRTVEFNAVAGDEIEVYITAPPPSTLQTTLQKVKGSFYITQNITIPYDGTVAPANFLPNIKQEKFIKDIIVRYGCYITTNTESKTVKFDLFKNVESKKTQASNWTSKIDISSLYDVDYVKLSQPYGILNKFTYKQDESERDFNENKTPLQDYNDVENIDSLGDGSFVLDNDFVVDEKIIYTSPLGATNNDSVGDLMTVEFGEGLMYIPYGLKTYSESGGLITELETSTQALKTYRVAIVLADTNLDLLSSYSGINVGNEDNTTAQFSNQIAYSYFMKESLDSEVLNNVNYNLAWSVNQNYNNDVSLLDDYYQEQISILNRGDIVKMHFILKESDLSNIDFSIPIYLDTPDVSGYYLINKIPKLNTLNEPIEVELIKLP